MKKLFFFISLFFLPFSVSAGMVENLEVLNGTLSRKFESNNNIYSVVLNEGESELKLNYKLQEEAQVELMNNRYVEGKENQVTLQVTSENKEKEIYTFFLEKESVTPVFTEVNLPTNSPAVKMPHLEIYVGVVCLFIILCLFKCIVLGFKRKK